MDSVCSHMGGPLGEQGDIEDIEGSACIRCPWHGRRVRAWAALYLWTLPTIFDKDILLAAA